MRTLVFRFRSVGFFNGCTLFVIGLLIPLVAFAANPGWWTNPDHPVLNGSQANDYAAVNQGQVKNLAVAAIAELNAHLPGGAGNYLNNTALPSLTGTSASTNDYAAVNLGQLKNLAKPIYYQLIAVGYTNQYPWVGSPSPANDFAMANIGQVKNLFSFDLMSTDSTHDTDGNGLPDWWEKYYFGYIGVDPNDDVNGNGVSTLNEFLDGTVPVNGILSITLTEPFGAQPLP